MRRNSVRGRVMMRLPGDDVGILPLCHGVGISCVLLCREWEFRSVQLKYCVAVSVLCRGEQVVAGERRDPCH